MKFKLVIAIILCSLSSLLFAKNINLYDLPKNDGKIIGTLDSEAGMIIIFTPKDTPEWVKVGDPKNGNVGWVKTSDTAGTSKFSFQVINSGSGPQSYQVIQMGVPQTLTPEQSAAIMKEFQIKQQIFQQNMKKWMENFEQSIKQFPMMFPVDITPENSSQDKKPKTEVKKP